jgi:hypothetical protein
MEYKALCDICIDAILSRRRVYLTMKDKQPKGFPRGELLCVNDEGSTRLYDPIKILVWLQKELEN